MRYIGIDHGKKTIGLAICDRLGMVATPIEPLQRQKMADDVQHIQKILDEYQISEIVIGMPYNMDGSEGPRCQSVRGWAQELSKHIPAFQHFWDERMTTQQSYSNLGGSKKTKEAKKVIDSLSAQCILQSFIDSKR